MATIRMTAYAERFGGSPSGYRFEGHDRKPVMVYPHIDSEGIVNWDIPDTEGNRSTLKAEFPSEVFSVDLVHVSDVQPLDGAAPASDEVPADPET